MLYPCEVGAEDMEKKGRDISFRSVHEHWASARRGSEIECWRKQASSGAWLAGRM